MCSEPSAYYAVASSLAGEELRAALHDLIKGHTVVSYDGAWGALKAVDEADGDAEMPEQLLTSVLLARIDPKRAPPFPPELVSYLSDEVNHRDPLPRASRVRAGNAVDFAASEPASDVCSASPPPSDAEDADDPPPSTLR